VMGVLHVRHQRGQPFLEQSGFFHRWRKGGVVDSPAARAPAGVGAVLRFRHDDGRELDLLEDIGRPSGRDKRVAAVRTALGMVIVEGIDFVGRKGGAFVQGMARLSAQLAFAFAPALRWGLGQVIRRRPLARIGGVLREHGHLPLERLNLPLQILSPLLQGLHNGALVRYFRLAPTVLRRPR